MTENSVKFSAPWGTAVRLISLVAGMILAGLPVVGLLALSDFHVPVFARYSMVITPILVLVISLAFVVRGYEVADGVLLVRRLGWTTRIALAGLKTAVIDPDAMNRSIRIFGNGGLFVISGLYRNNALGLYRAYVTDLKHAIVMRFTDRTIVISPDAPERFLELLRVRGFLAA